MDILKELCSIPTAPFAEDRVIAFVEQFVARRPGLRLRRDPWRNLLIELPGREPGLPRWVFVAHIDHPGMLARRMILAKELDAEFLGGVGAEYLKGEKVSFHSGDSEVRGVINAVRLNAKTKRPKAVVVRVDGPVPKGAIGMFDQGVGRYKGQLFHSRGCDDVAGAAALLATLDELLAQPADAPAAMLLTRAEETGFVGALAAVRDGRLFKKTDRLVSVECSAEQPVARQGDGVILRIGDKTTVFDSGLSYFIAQQAEDLAKRDKTFKWQRALMPGGNCEATVFSVYGHRTAAACVALGNYHNMDRARKRIGPEYIHRGDWRNMVKLFAHVVRRGHTFDGTMDSLKAKLDERYVPLIKRLKQPSCVLAR